MVTESENLKEHIKIQWAMIEKLQTRLPLWATGIMSLSTFVIGLLVGWVFHLETIMKTIAHS